MTLYVWSHGQSIRSTRLASDCACATFLCPSVSAACGVDFLFPSNVCCCISFLHWSVCGVQCCATQLTHTLPLFNSYPAFMGVCECRHEPDSDSAVLRV